MLKKAVSYMLAIAEHSTMAQAALYLHVTPSALSKYIKNIEEEIGTPLFRRAGRKTQLTQSGERYLAWCRRINRDYQMMMDEMGGLAAHDTGLIRLGIVKGVFSFLVADAIDKFYAAYPNTHIELMEDSQDALAKLLTNNQCDFIITYNPHELKSFELLPLLQSRHVIITPAGHPLASKAIANPKFRYPWVPLKACAGENFITQFPHQRTRNSMDKFFEAAQLRCHIKMEINYLASIVEAVSMGIGITLLPDLFAARHYHEGRVSLLGFGKEESLMMTYLAYRKNFYFSAPAKYLLELLHETVETV
jgi:LysR family cyn operon transcriptional activator